MITGLEQDNYCAHNPIPVVVSDDEEIILPTIIEMQISVGGVDQLATPPVFYAIGGIFKINLSAWVKQLLPRFEDLIEYTEDVVVHPNPYSVEATIKFSGEGYTEEITRSFLHCVNNEFGWFTPSCIKMWRCYPFSTLDSELNRVAVIPMGDEAPEIDACETIDYDPSCCPGVYLKWLNENGYYYYWLFPQVDEHARESEELFKVPRNIFDPIVSSNEDTVGFEATDTRTLRDKIHYNFWPMFYSLASSPEVYILNPKWGGGTVTPNDWIKVIQSKPEFATNSKNTIADFEMDFQYPKVYTQTLI